MRIDWEYESFESDLKVWITEFRGMRVEIRQEPGVEHQVIFAITAGSQTLWERAEPNEQIAMVNSLKWINGYWDLLEDGPDVQYQALDVSGLDSTDKDLPETPCTEA